MNMKKYFFYLLFILVIVSLFPANGFCLTDLEELEKRISLSDDARILDLDESMAVSAKDKAAADSGLKISGGVGYGWNREPESLTSSDRIYYENLFSRVALTIPVLGSRWQEQTGVLKTERTVLEKKYAVEIYKKIALSSLRKEYINLCVAARKLQLARAFLEDEAYISSILKEKIRPGFLLKADFQEFMTAFDRARREVANSRMIMEKARGSISRLTGVTPDQNFVQSPRLPSPEMHAGKIREKIGIYNPELTILEQIVSKNNDILKKTSWSGFESSIDLAYAPATTYPGTFGQGASISFNVRAPIAVTASNRAAEKRAELEIQKSQTYISKIKSETLTDYITFQAAHQASLKNLAFASQRLASSFEWLRESRLRRKYLEGDVFEKYLQARYNYFGAAMDALDAEALTFKSCADLLMIAEEKDNLQPRSFISEKLPGYELRKRWISESNFSPYLADIADKKKMSTAVMQQERKRCSFGVYIWNSSDILQDNSDRFWKKIKFKGIDRVLVSFDRGQIEKVRTGKMAASIYRFVVKAKINGVLTELLLGDPAWILPEKRKDLLDIINVFKNFEFDGLHLDLEPDQLKELDDNERKIMTGYVLDTLKEVSAISKWPLGVSLHPRYFDEATAGICLGCELENLGINEVSLMIYSSDIQKVAAKTKEIMQAYPLLRFAVAQSFEPALPGGESHYRKGKAVFWEDMVKLYNSVKGNNFNSIIIQSWKDITGVNQK